MVFTLQSFALRPFALDTVKAVPPYQDRVSTKKACLRAWVVDEEGGSCPTFRSFLPSAFCEFGSDGSRCEEPPLPPTTAYGLCTSRRLGVWATKQLGPYGPKIAKSFRFDKLGAGGDDTWLGGGAPRRKVSPIRNETWYESSCLHYFHRFFIV